jgi:CheY-like chemotaxis protein
MRWPLIGSNQINQENGERRAAARIVLIEDSPADVYLAQEALAESGVAAHLVVAASLQEGLALLETADAPDAVLLDLNLPDGSGHHALAQIRRDPRLQSLPVIVLTTSSDGHDRMLAVELGADGYWIKPSSFDEFIEMMRGLPCYFGRSLH